MRKVLLSSVGVVLFGLITLGRADQCPDPSALTANGNNWAAVGDWQFARGAAPASAEGGGSVRFNSLTSYPFSHDQVPASACGQVQLICTYSLDGQVMDFYKVMDGVALIPDLINKWDLGGDPRVSIATCKESPDACSFTLVPACGS